jgi:hypothetical protein
MERHVRRKFAVPATLVPAATLAALLAVSSASGRSQAAPTNTKEPTISGVPLVGNTLTANRGTWKGKGPMNFAFRWGRCDTNAANCLGISGATQKTYQLTNADVGHTIRVRVIAKNPDGQTTADSNATSIVSTQSGAPANSKAPAISGSAIVGSTLSANVGTWVGNTPITYAYKWQRCDSAGNACKDLQASGASYSVVKGDLGKTLRVKVTAKNSVGKSTAFSEATAVVQDATGGGVIVLPNGEKSVPATDVPNTARLIVSQVNFSPNPVTSRQTLLQIRVKVKDTRGYVVRGAIVFVRSTPILTAAAPQDPTGTDGTITYTVLPRSDFPLKTGYSVQFFVKAFRKGDPTLAGIAGYRLVQVATATP